MRPGRTAGTLATLVAAALLATLSIVLTTSLMTASVVADDSFEMQTAPGATESRAVLGDTSAGQVLSMEYSPLTSTGSRVTLVVCDDETFIGWRDHVKGGGDASDPPDELADRMLFIGVGAIGSATVNTSGGRLFIGVHNDGPGNLSMKVDYTLTTRSQPVCLGFLLPVIVLCALAGWAALRDSGPGARSTGKGAPPHRDAYAYGPRPGPPYHDPYGRAPRPPPTPPPPYAGSYPCLNCGAVLWQDAEGAWYCPRCGKEY